MTHFLEDIRRQPDELLQLIGDLCCGGRPWLDDAANLIRGARHVYLTGIGASWNAVLAGGSIFHTGGRPVYMLDAAELLQFSKIPPGAVIVILSRSGRSIEIVQLLKKARDAGARVIGVTNFPNGILAQEADVPVILPVRADHAISVNTYSSLAFGLAAIATATVSSFDERLAITLSHAVEETAKVLSEWQSSLESNSWLRTGVPYIFLARGSSMATAYEARLLWEEGAKFFTRGMGTSTFRHGPQEAIVPDARLAIWIDPVLMREQDLAMARDLRAMGASVMLVGYDLPADAADLLISLPKIPGQWQFLIDVIPAQLGAERFSRLRGVDCDSFRFASYIVEDDTGLLPRRGASSLNLE